MPAYEYECHQCGGHFEQRQKMSDPAIESCPVCGGQVKRLISGGAGVLSNGGSATMGAACEMSGQCDMPAMGCGAGCGCAH